MIADIVIFALIAGYCIFLVVRGCQKKKRAAAQGGCAGCCAGCSGCCGCTGASPKGAEQDG